MLLGGGGRGGGVVVGEEEFEFPMPGRSNMYKNLAFTSSFSLVSSVPMQILIQLIANKIVLSIGFLYNKLLLRNTHSHRAYYALDLAV